MDDNSETTAHLQLVDRIDRAIGSVLFSVSNFPERAQPRLLGTDMAPLRSKILDAVLDAIEAGS